MARAYYVREDKSGNPILRRLLLYLLIFALVGGIAVGLFIYKSDLESDRILKDFQSALQDRRYAGAIALYRQAQEKSLNSSSLERSPKKYQVALSSMETLTNQRLQQIETRLMGHEQLQPDDLTFTESLAEVSAVRMISFLRGLCRDYLVGKIERVVLESSFAQLAPLKNLSDTVGGLPAEFDRMEQAQGKMIAAIENLQNKAYWAAYSGFDQIVKDASLTGFVQDQAKSQIEICKKEMYPPLLDSARKLIAGSRFLSAQAALNALAAVFPGDEAILRELAACKTRVPEKLVDYVGPIEVISIKPLIVNTKRAFDGDSYAATAADSMMTVKEFSAMLTQLYANQYILIDATRIYQDNRKINRLLLPPGKKPLVIVVEGLNYYASRRETGNNWDLVLDESGEVSALYPDANGQMIVDRKGEAIGILDEFVKEHPDFSLDGAKGTISLTGYECIFGSITHIDQLDDRNKALQDNGGVPISLTAAEIAANAFKVKEIMDRLKMTGWIFASSTYGFIDARGQSLERITADTQKWQEQVGSLTGPVSFLNYPNGSFIPGSDPRAKWLKEQGFILFGGLGTTAYLYAGQDYLYIDKTPVNGFTMQNSQTYQLGRLFDVKMVYDKNARPK